MTIIKNYNLELRTLTFAKNVRNFCKQYDKNNNLLWNDINQVIRSSGSIGANYIETNEALSKKDFVLKIKICRKESKETTYWLNLLPKINCDHEQLIQESIELMKIFGAILEKTKNQINTKF